MLSLETRLSHAARARVARLRRRPLGILLVALVGATVMFLMSAQPHKAQAFSSYLDAFRLQYPRIAGTKLDACILCHTTTTGGPLNSYGSAYGANGHNFVAIENMDSDGDGFSNITEINALTFPGDAADHPAQPTASSPPPTATSTGRPPSPTPTATPTNPTATSTAPSATPTSTSETPPPNAPGLDFRAFRVAEHVTLANGETDPVWIWLAVKNNGGAGGRGTATVVGVLNGVEVYHESMAVSAAGRRRGRYFFPRYVPTAAGQVMWTASLDDGDPDTDTATAATEVTAGRPPEDDRASELSATQPVVTPAAAASDLPAAQLTVSENATPSELPAAQPAATQDTTAPDGQCAGTHVVGAGENLFRIGYNCGFSLRQMAIANGIGFPYTIYPGQMLRYP